MKKYVFLALVGLALLSVFLIINSQRSIRIKIENMASDELKDVIVVAGGDGAYLGDIVSRGSLRSKLLPFRDDVVSVFYRHQGVWVYADVQEYVTNGASLDIEIKIPVTTGNNPTGQPVAGPMSATKNNMDSEDASRR